MDGYEQFLVVVLATFLALALVLGIVLLALLIKIARTVKRITDKAEQLTDKAEAVGEFFQHAAGPMAFGRVISIIVDTFFHRSEKQKSKRD